MRWSVAALGLCSMLCALVTPPSAAAQGGGAAAEPEIAGPSSAEPGVWRTRTLQVFDPAERTLVRRLYTVWDPQPSRDLDFVWIPASLAEDREGPVTGEGRLIWRIKGQPSYDRTSIYAEFQGSMRDGRQDGRGTYVDQTGMVYDGEWKKGVVDGYGALKLPGHDEYLGQFRGGKANGSGRYVDITGETFEGQFLNGLREGRGTTTLPNGATYRSIWVAGRETEWSRSVRFSQAGTPRLPGGTDDVRIAVGLDTSRLQDGAFRYAASSAGATLAIKPADRRLLQVWKGGGAIQLTPDEEWGLGPVQASREYLLPPALSVEIQNRSNAPLQVAGLFLDVRSSVTDLQPAVQLRVGLINQCGESNYRPNFKLENYGWGPAESARLRFAFSSPTARPATLNLSKSLGRIDKEITVDLEPELQAAGVNTDVLKRRAQAGLPCRSRDKAACLAELRSAVFGSFGPHLTLDDVYIVAGAVGTLEYGWTDAKGVRKTETPPFAARLVLGRLTHDPEGVPCAELGTPVKGAQKPLQLRLDHANYRIPVTFPARAVPPGRISRLTVAVQAAKSSQHDFHVVLQLADGREISSRPISLVYYSPKWFQ